MQVRLEVDRALRAVLELQVHDVVLENLDCGDVHGFDSLPQWFDRTAEARIAAIRAAGADIKHLDALQADARNLDELAHPSPGGFGLDGLDQIYQLDQIDQLLDAVDVRTTWAEGRPVPTAELAHAVATLNDTARHAPLLALDSEQIDCSQWLDLLDPVTERLRQRGLDIPAGRPPQLERGSPEHGIDL